MTTRRAPEELLDEAGLDIALRAYDNFKNHARFAETQRFGFFIAYFGATGAIGTAILNRLFSAGPLDGQTRWVIAAVLGALIVAGVLVGIAVIKLGVAFYRHYSRAESLIAALRKNGSQDERMLRVLDCAVLPTLGNENKKAERFGSAAAYIYLICLLIGIKGAAIAALLCVASNSKTPPAITTFPLARQDAILLFAVFALAMTLA